MVCSIHVPGVSRDPRVSETDTAISRSVGNKHFSLPVYDIDLLCMRMYSYISLKLIEPACFIDILPFLQDHKAINIPVLA